MSVQKKKNLKNESEHSEHSFSLMGQIKTRLWNKMGLPSLLTIESELVKELDFEDSKSKN